jgi:hypothetical protein
MSDRKGVVTVGTKSRNTDRKATMTRRTDRKGRVTLPSSFAGCLVVLDVRGDEVRIRKAKRVTPRRYSFKELMAGVTPDNIHAEVETGPPVGREEL